MYGPTCVFWANLTPFSPKRYKASEQGSPERRQQFIEVYRRFLAEVVAPAVLRSGPARGVQAVIEFPRVNLLYAAVLYVWASWPLDSSVSGYGRGFGVLVGAGMAAAAAAVATAWSTRWPRPCGAICQERGGRC